METNTPVVVDIAAVTNDSLGALLASGRVHEMINAHVEKTVQHIVADVLREYSPFGKALKAAIEAALPTSFDSLALADYNEAIIEAVRAKMDAVMEESVTGQVNQMLSEMLREFPADLKVSALVDMVREAFRDDSDDEEFTFLIEEDDGYSCSNGYKKIGVDKEPGKRFRDCEFKLCYNAEGELYHTVIDGTDPKRKLFRGRAYGIERIMYALYYGRTKLVFDIGGDDVDNSFNRYED